VNTAMQILKSAVHPDGQLHRFGIVTTGEIWKGELTRGIAEAFGGRPGPMAFLGVETTGLDATDLHDMPGDVVRNKIKEATRSLVAQGEGNLKVVILGCAGMAGMDEWVREEAEEDVTVVDPVKAGVAVLQGLIRCSFRTGSIRKS
jgi:Asp/Glu/hydantoin racemase